MRPSVRAVTGLVLGSFVYLLMRRRHIPFGGLTWDDRAMPQPALLHAGFSHPWYGLHVGYRAKYCVGDWEVVQLLTDKAPSWWREPVKQEET